MLDKSSPYYRQVELVIRVLPLVARQSHFALKGGTAINLFIRDLPRLSVDIDLTYLPLDTREIAIPAMEDALKRIADTIKRIIPGASVNAITGHQKLQVSANGVQVKIEVSPVLRGTVLPPVKMEASDSVTEQFGYVETQVLMQEELYAGKLVAALDRQHPRDLFDVKVLLENEGISSRLMDLFVVYVASSNRPMSELLQPNLIPLQSVFENQFRGMSQQSITIKELEATRLMMLEQITELITDDQKAFLISFKKGTPDWDALAYPQIKQLPAIRWKLQNILRLSASNRENAVRKLKATLSI